MSLFAKNDPVCVFNDGLVSTNLVGAMKYFNGKAEFLKYCKDEYGQDFVKPLEVATIDNVYMSHVRWFPNGVEGMDEDERRGVFSIGRSGKGSVDVWVCALKKVLEKYPDEYEAMVNIGGEYAEIDEESINCVHSERVVELMEIG